MLARFCSRSKALEAFSARARLGSKIIFCAIARALLGSKNFLLGSLELEKFTLVPNTIIFLENMCSQMELDEKPIQNLNWSITILKGRHLLDKTTLERVVGQNLFKNDFKTYFIDVHKHWKQ